MRPGKEETDPDGFVPRHLRGVSYAVAVLVTILWSSSYVLIKMGLQEVPPLYFATVRYALAFVLLVAVDIFTHRNGDAAAGKPPLKAPLWILLVAGVAGYTVAQGFQYVGLFFLPAVTTSFLLNFTPVFVLLLGVLSLNEKPSRLQTSGLAVALLGAYLFFSEKISWEGEVLGFVVVLASGLGWAVYVIIIGRLQKTNALSSLRLTTVTMGVGVAGMIVLTAATQEYAPLTYNLVLVVAWLAVVNTAFAFFLWNWALKTLPSYELTVVQNLMLIEIALFAFVFLQETITSFMVAGIVLVFVGVMAVQVRPRRTGVHFH